MLASYGNIVRRTTVYTPVHGPHCHSKEMIKAGKQADRAQRCLGLAPCQYVGLTRANYDKQDSRN
jgi:hypothetical protein